MDELAFCAYCVAYYIYNYSGDRTALCIIKVIIIIAKYLLKNMIMMQTHDAIFYNVSYIPNWLFILSIDVIVFVLDSACRILASGDRKQWK